MDDTVATSVLDQAPSTGMQTEATEKSSANEDCENQESGRDHSFTNIALLTAAPLTFRQGFHLRQEKARNQPLTEYKKACLKRLDYEETYDVPLTEAVLEFDDGGKGRKRFERFRSLMFPFTYSGCLTQLLSGEDRECNFNFF